MKELPDSVFNMRACFYEESKVKAMIKKRPICRVHTYLAHGLEEAKKIPNWFLIEEIQKPDFSQVYTVNDENFLKAVGKTIMRRSGINDL